jgi:hypothetical protein
MAEFCLIMIEILMSGGKSKDRPVGVYLVALYFVLTGFLEAIQNLRESESPLIWNPIKEHSVWHLASDLLIYLALAYLVWRLTRLGRLAALVFGYLYLSTHFVYLALYAGGTSMNSTPLFFVLSVYHIITLPFLLYYLQTKPRKELFKASLVEVLLPHD